MNNVNPKDNQKNEVEPGSMKNTFVLLAVSAVAAIAFCATALEALAQSQ
jgi:hypothetical protein